MTEYNANCFICNREIELAWNWGSPAETESENQKVAEDNPLDALSVTIAGGYGSCHDGLYGKMWICDPCFADRIDRLMHVGNYFDNYVAIANAEEILEAAYERIRNENLG